MTPADAPSAPPPQGGAASGPAEPVPRRLLGGAEPGRDAALIERRTGGCTLVQGGFVELRRDEVQLPDGSAATREYIAHPGAVAVLPILDDGRLVLVRQYRYPVARVQLEIPAGKLDAGENTLACAMRELREETGYEAREWSYGCEIHNAAAYSTESIWIWFARGLVAGAQQLDEGEFVEVVTHTEAELDALAAGAGLPDVKTRIALQQLQRWRAGAWPLVWRSADEALLWSQAQAHATADPRSSA